MNTYKKLELTPRLCLLADWVRPGARIADVGTDHAYLPIWLIQSGRVERAIASDLRPGPLERARADAAAYGVLDRLDLRLCSGLDGIRPGEADTIVIAGMGGENIAAILAAAPWTRDGRHTLLLQPMTRSEILRGALAELGFQIQEERLVLDRGTIYPAMLVCAGKMDLSDGQRYGGAALTQDPLQDRYLIRTIIRTQSALAGLRRSESGEDLAKAEELERLLSQLFSMREEWRHANSKGN